MHHKHGFRYQSSEPSFHRQGMPVPSPFDLTIQRDCIVNQDWTLKEYETGVFIDCLIHPKYEDTVTTSRIFLPLT